MNHAVYSIDELLSSD